jgi:Dolichyl-phosphate-mannose-protein mannosyltransferase
MRDENVPPPSDENAAPLAEAVLDTRRALGVPGESRSNPERAGRGPAGYFWHEILGSLLVMVLLSALAVSFQAASGAYHVELSGYPDEPAHAVTAIMFDRYVRDGFPRPVVSYAEHYYVHYPKVAIGHWPPLLYMVESIGTLIFAPSRIVLLGVQALLAGVMAAIVFSLLSKSVGRVAAALGAVGFLSVPVVQAHTSMVMAEILLTLTCLCSTLAFARLLRTFRVMDGLLFGIATSAAILTKGTGWCLAIMAFSALVLTREWKLLRSAALWIAILVVALLCLPWQVLTLKMAAIGWDGTSPAWAFTKGAAIGFTKRLFTVPGWAVTSLAIAGVMAGRTGDRRISISPLYASLWGLVLADWLFHVVVPAGVEDRKMILAVPALFVLAGVAAGRLTERFSLLSKAQFAGPILFVCAVLCGVATVNFPIRKKPAAGYIAIARDLHAWLSPDTATLVSGDEGALISEFALIEPEPSKYIVRATKILSQDSWNGSGYESLIHTQEECRQKLSAVPISVVVLDLNPKLPQEHKQILKDLITTHPEEWIRVDGLGSAGTQNLAVYRSAQGMQPVRNPTTEMHVRPGLSAIASGN